MRGPASWLPAELRAARAARAGADRCRWRRASSGRRCRRSSRSRARGMQQRRRAARAQCRSPSGEARSPTESRGASGSVVSDRRSGRRGRPRAAGSRAQRSYPLTASSGRRPFGDRAPLATRRSQPAGRLESSMDRPGSVASTGRRRGGFERFGKHQRPDRGARRAAAGLPADRRHRAHAIAGLPRAGPT